MRDEGEEKVGFAEKKLRLWGIDAIDAIDAIEAIEAIVAVGFWGCGLGGMKEIKKSASPKKKPLRGKKVGFAEEKLWLWGLAWAKRGARQKIV